jgi:rhodanese-related sulfurtransferase
LFRFAELVVMAMMVLATAGCASEGDDSPVPATTGVRSQVTLLDPAAFRAAITTGSTFLVNVHVPYEGEIEGTDAFIPFDRVKADAAKLPDDKDAPLYIYCRSGRMSAEAAPAFQALGYTNIIDLEGGMVAWRDAGLPLIGLGPFMSLVDSANNSVAR